MNTKLRMSFKVLIVIALAVVMQSAAFAQCTGAGVCTGGASPLCVNDVAAMEGVCGLEITPDGVNTFVQDTTPNNETVYRFSYQFDVNNFDMPSPSLVWISEVFGFIGPSFGISARVMLRRRANGIYDTRARFFTNTRGARDTGTFTLGLTPDPARLCVEWSAGQSNTGELAYAVVQPETSPCPASGDPAYLVANTTNGFWVVDGINMGAARTTPAGPGSMYFDDFQSFRTLAP